MTFSKFCAFSALSGTMKTQLILLSLLLHVSSANKTSLQEFACGNKFFTASVYKEMRQKENSNFLTSPFSAEMVLALAQSGAKDQTAQEIITSLHLPTCQKEIEDTIQSLKSSLRKEEEYTFQSANKIYVKNNFKIKKNFKKIATEVFDSEVENIDFTKKEAANTMNQWVEKKTQNKIRNLIQSNLLNDETKLILINALYFKGNWWRRFKAGNTKKDDFYKSGKEVENVDTMHDTQSKKFHENKALNAKFLELPFEGGDATMTFVLPNEKEGLTALEDQLEKVLQAVEYTEERVIMSIPKFKIETQLDFTELLQKMGVEKAFNKTEADFSGIGGEKGELVIDLMLQKTFVDLNEDGVEAAAASFIGMFTGSSLNRPPPPPPKEFKADHPFIFFIKIKNLIIFAGRVVDPNES